MRITMIFGKAIDCQGRCSICKDGKACKDCSVCIIAGIVGFSS